MLRIDSELFMQQASNLRVGQSMRGDHDCNGVSTGTLLISRQVGKVTAYCFRCGGQGFHAEQESLADKLQRAVHERDADAEARATVQLPEPRVYDLHEWPRDAALWLYKAGFSPSMIEDMGVYWCPKLGRVVLPIMVDGHAVFWQARSVRRQPKILSPVMRRKGIVAKYGRGDTIVLCEDSLSAYKVGRETEAWSLLGTKLLPGPLAELIGQSKPVIVWLDSDVPGQRAAAQIIKTLRAYGVAVRNVVTPKDPKLYDRQFIQEILREPV